MTALSLPTHPFTGLRAIGVLDSGRIVWPVLGGSGEGEGGEGGSGGSGDGGGQGQGEGGNGDGKSSDRTFTQADVERIVGERLGRERGKYADYDELKAKAAKFDEVEEQNKTEQQKVLDRAEKAEKRAAEAEARAKAAEVASLRAKVASAKRLPAELVDRLRGETEEEIAKDADALLKSIGGDANGSGGFDQGTRGGGGTNKPSVTSGADLYAQRHGKTT